MSMTEYALPIEQDRTQKARTSGPLSLSMMLFIVSVATTAVAKLLG